MKEHSRVIFAWAGFLLFGILAIIIYPFEWNLEPYCKIESNDNTVLSVLGIPCVGFALWILKLDRSLWGAVIVKGDNKFIYAWIGFVLLNALTRIIYSYGSAIERYLLVLSLLGVASLGFAIWVLKINRFSPRSSILVVIGLLFGQLWFLLGLFLIFSWSLVGFAP